MSVPDNKAKNASERPVPFAVGQVLADKYLLQEVIGEGGVGIVVAAQHLELDEPVAIKFLRPDAMADGGLVGRFAREAKAAVSIRSEHVVRVFDVGTAPNGAPYFVMERLQGQDLATALQARGKLPVREAIEYAMQACDALAAAHAKGIVHRDIKPENLFLTATDSSQEIPVIKVLDFGISKAALTGSILGNTMPLVKTVNLMGTPLYMSPEQIRRTDHVDARSDVWSLGMVVYEMLAGTTAFSAGSSITELCAAILEAPVAPLHMHRPDVPHELVDVVARCLEKDPARRYQNVAELAIALMPFGPSRARICAERAATTLRSAGLLQATVRFDSAFPPPMPSFRPSGSPSYPGPQPSTPSVSVTLTATPSNAPAVVQPKAAPKRGRALVAGGAVLIAAIALGVVVTRTGNKSVSSEARAANAPPPTAAPIAEPAAEMVTAPGVSVRGPEARPAAASATAPKAAAAPATRGPARPAWSPQRATAPSAKPQPSTTARPKGTANDDPDLGY